LVRKATSLVPQKITGYSRYLWDIHDIPNFALNKKTNKKWLVESTTYEKFKLATSQNRKWFMKFLKKWNSKTRVTVSSQHSKEGTNWNSLHYYVLCSLSSLYEEAEPNTQKQQKMEP
jgi:hypothetical protein